MVTFLPIKKKKISHIALNLFISLENIIVDKTILCTVMMLDFCILSEHDMKLYTKIEGAS